MSPSTYYLEYGRHLARLHRRRRRRAYAPTSNTASHDIHEKISSWVSMGMELCLELRFKFTVVYCESVNLIGYITVCYLLIVNSYASVHIARHV